MKSNNYLPISIEFFTSLKVSVKSYNKYPNNTSKIKKIVVFFEDIIFLFIIYTIIKPKAKKFGCRITTYSKNFISYIIKYSNRQTTFIIHNESLKNVFISILGILIFCIKLMSTEVLYTIHYTNQNRAYKTHPIG